MTDQPARRPVTHRFPNHPGETRTGGRYDGAHKKARKNAADKHHPDDPCVRCGHPLGPMGRWLHYDHTDDGHSYLGFAHGSRPCPTCGRRCNIQAGADLGAARAAGRPVAPAPRRATRTW